MDQPDHGGREHNAAAPRGVVDWTLTPAKWGAVGVLALVGCMGLAWSVIRGEGRIAAVPADSATPSRVAAARDAAMGSEPRSEIDAAEAVPNVPLDVPAAVNPGPRVELAVMDSGGAAVSPPVVEVREPAVEVVTTPQPAPVEAPAANPAIAQKVNINTASEAELQALPGIGPSRAAAIVADRRANGPFRSVEELDRVRGIGAGIIEGLREFARVR